MSRNGRKHISEFSTNIKGADQTVPMDRLVCGFVVCMQQNQVFLRPGPWKLLGCWASKQNIKQVCSGWVVMWFLLGYTVRMFEYTVRTF